MYPAFFLVCTSVQVIPSAQSSTRVLKVPLPLPTLIQCTFHSSTCVLKVPRVFLRFHACFHSSTRVFKVPTCFSSSMRVFVVPRVFSQFHACFQSSTRVTKVSRVQPQFHCALHWLEFIPLPGAAGFQMSNPPVLQTVSLLSSLKVRFVLTNSFERGFTVFLRGTFSFYPLP